LAIAKEPFVKLRRKTRLLLERLEDRLTPASFNLVYSGNSLTITQNAPLSGASDTLNVTDNVTAGMIVLTDAGAGGTVTDVPVAGVDNVTLNLLANSAAPTVRTVTYDLGASGRSGNLTVNLNNGATTFDVNDNGGTGSVTGNLRVASGAGNDTFTLASTGSLSVGDNVYLAPGAGTQTISLGNTDIGNSLYVTSMTGTDTIGLGSGAGQTFSSGGNVFIFTGPGNNTLTLGAPANGTATVGGSLTASGIATFTLNANSSITGNATLAAGIKSITYTFNAGSFVGGNVTTSYSGGTPLASSTLMFAGTIGNNLGVTLGNTGGDSVAVSGSVGGNMTVFAGSNGKTIALSPTASVGDNFTAILGNGLAGQNLVSITGGASVGRNAYVSLGNTTSAGGNLLDLSGAQVGANLTAIGGSGADTLKTTASGATGATAIGGSVYVNLGLGPNTATISGTVGGPSITYLSGPGNDTVTINANSFAAMYIDLGAAPPGSTKTVNLGVRPRSAFINFGVGTGTKTLNLSGTATPVNYPLTVLNK
jgi:hypothetical protein